MTSDRHVPLYNRNAMCSNVRSAGRVGQHHAARPYVHRLTSLMKWQRIPLNFILYNMVSKVI